MLFAPGPFMQGIHEWLARTDDHVVAGIEKARSGHHIKRLRLSFSIPKYLTPGCSHLP